MIVYKHSNSVTERLGNYLTTHATLTATPNVKFIFKP